MQTELKIKELKETKNGLNKIKNQKSKKDNTLPNIGNSNVLYSKTGKTYILTSGQINVVL